MFSACITMTIAGGGGKGDVKAISGDRILINLMTPELPVCMWQGHGTVSKAWRKLCRSKLDWIFICSHLLLERADWTIWNVIRNCMTVKRNMLSQSSKTMDRSAWLCIDGIISLVILRFYLWEVLSFCPTVSFRQLQKHIDVRNHGHITQ